LITPSSPFLADLPVEIVVGPSELSTSSLVLEKIADLPSSGFQPALLLFGGAEPERSP